MTCGIIYGVDHFILFHPSDDEHVETFVRYLELLAVIILFSSFLLVEILSNGLKLLGALRGKEVTFSLSWEGLIYIVLVLIASISISIYMCVQYVLTHIIVIDRRLYVVT